MSGKSLVSILRGGKLEAEILSSIKLFITNKNVILLLTLYSQGGEYNVTLLLVATQKTEMSPPQLSGSPSGWRQVPTAAGQESPAPQR